MRNRSYQHIVIPSLFVLLPFVLFRLESRREWIYQLVSLLPYLLFGVVAFLGYKLNQRRIVIVGLGIASGLWYLNQGVSSVGPAERAQLLAFAIPLTLAGLFCFSEKFFRGWRVFPALVLCLVPLIALHASAASHQAFLGSLLRWRLWAPPALAPQLPHAGLLPLFFFLVLIGVATDPYMQIFRLYILASLVPIGFALARATAIAGPAQTPENALCFFCAAGLLSYGVFYLYWRKVYLDELMGIPNRRALNERLSKLSGQYAIAMVDIDHFKRFNDTYGHEQGDTVLKFVASHLAQNIRGETFRYGGEEIAVIFDGKATPYGASQMDSVRDSLAKREFRIRASSQDRKRTSRRQRSRGAWSGISVRVTVSIGVASLSHEGQSPEEVLSAADSALYRAKQSGRNKVVAMQELAVETVKAKVA